MPKVFLHEIITYMHTHTYIYNEETYKTIQGIVHQFGVVDIGHLKTVKTMI